MIIAKASRSQIVITLLLLGICLRIGEMDSLFSWKISEQIRNSVDSAEVTFTEYQVHNQEDIHQDTLIQQYNKETIHARRSFATLKNSKKMFNRGLQKNPLFICTTNVYLQNLNSISVILSKEVFQGLRNDLMIVEFIHQKDGKKSDEVSI